MDSGQFKILLVAVILVQITGFAVLWMKIPPPATAAPKIASSSKVIVPAVDPNSIMFAAKIPQEEVLRQAVDSVLKQELAPYLAKLAEAKNTLPQGNFQPTEGSRRPSAASIQAAQQSNIVVDQAIASGVWTNDDSSALLRNASKLSEAQRVELLEKIFGAINSQQLKPVGSLPSL